jgi:hypothetical protein
MALPAHPAKATRDKRVVQILDMSTPRGLFDKRRGVGNCFKKSAQQHSNLMTSTTYEVPQRRIHRPSSVGNGVAGCHLPMSSGGRLKAQSMHEMSTNSIDHIVIDLLMTIKFAWR